MGSPTSPARHGPEFQPCGAARVNVWKTHGTCVAAHLRTPSYHFYLLWCLHTYSEEQTSKMESKSDSSGSRAHRTPVCGEIPLRRGLMPAVCCGMSPASLVSPNKTDTIIPCGPALSPIYKRHTGTTNMYQPTDHLTIFDGLVRHIYTVAWSSPCGGCTGPSVPQKKSICQPPRRHSTPCSTCSPASYGWSKPDRNDGTRHGCRKGYDVLQWLEKNNITRLVRGRSPTHGCCYN